MTNYIAMLENVNRARQETLGGSYLWDSLWDLGRHLWTDKIGGHPSAPWEKAGLDYHLLNTEKGAVPVEIRQGCADLLDGVGVHVDGICVVHFTDYGDIAKMEVYDDDAYAAGIRWVDNYNYKSEAKA